MQTTTCDHGDIGLPTTSETFETTACDLGAGRDHGDPTGRDRL